MRPSIVQVQKKSRSVGKFMTEESIFSLTMKRMLFLMLHNLFSGCYEDHFLEKLCSMRYEISSFDQEYQRKKLVLFPVKLDETVMLSTPTD